MHSLNEYNFINISLNVNVSVRHAESCSNYSLLDEKDIEFLKSKKLKFLLQQELLRRIKEFGILTISPPGQENCPLQLQLVTEVKEIEQD